MFAHPIPCLLDFLVNVFSFHVHVTTLESYLRPAHILLFALGFVTLQLNSCRSLAVHVSSSVHIVNTMTRWANCLAGWRSISSNWAIEYYFFVYGMIFQFQSFCFNGVLYNSITLLRACKHSHDLLINYFLHFLSYHGFQATNIHLSEEPSTFIPYLEVDSFNWRQTWIMSLSSWAGCFIATKAFKSYNLLFSF